MLKQMWMWLAAIFLLGSAQAFSDVTKKPAAGSRSTGSAQRPSLTKSKRGTKASRKRVRRRRGPRGQRAPSADRIREIQAVLGRKGAYSSEPTGKWDAASIAALKRFQSANGLHPTGKLDAQSLQKLGLGSEVAGMAPPRPPVQPATADGQQR